jgi:hypothetical protein
MLWASVTAALLASGDPCTAYNAEGEPFAVCFDPGRGISLGTSVLARGAGTLSLAPVYTAVVMYRTADPSRSKEKEHSLWFNTHRILDTRAQPDDPAKSLLVTAYQATLRRHIEEGFILIPTSSPIRLPFPFDVAIDVGVMRYERRVFEGPGYTVELAHAALLFDPLRSEGGRKRLAIGPSLSDTVRVMPGSAVNEISPFTSLQMDAGYETEDGWWAARLNAIGGWTYVPGVEGRFRARATASVERVLLAINNQPVDLVLSGFGALNDAGVQHRSEWGAGLGVAVRPFAH